MTVKGLSEFLKRHNISYSGRRSSRDSKLPLTFASLKGKRVAIEGATILYKIVASAAKITVDNYTYIMKEDGWTYPSDSDILVLYRKFFRSFISRLKDSGIIPVFIVEGQSPQAKIATSQKRTSIKQNYMKEAMELRLSPNLDEFKKKITLTYTPLPIYVQNTISILKEEGVKTLKAKYEAEGVCAYLVLNHKDVNHCDLALCEDHDIFMYGCPIVIKNMNTAPSNVGHFECVGYLLINILLSMGFLSDSTPDKDAYNIAVRRFRLFCILCGTDYADNIPGIGPETILKLMSEHNIITYQDAIKVEPRFSQIPYHTIIKVLESNFEYKEV
jgi:5'-3' exonuclease